LFAYKEQRNMRYVTSIERSAIAEGRAKGLAESHQSMKDMLFGILQKKLKLSNLQIDLQNQIQELSVKQVQALCLDSLDFDTIDDLVAWLWAKSFSADPSY
jgi:predicted transposase YdaD